MLQIFLIFAFVKNKNICFRNVFIDKRLRTVSTLTLHVTRLPRYFPCDYERF